MKAVALVGCDQSHLRKSVLAAKQLILQRKIKVQCEDVKQVMQTESNTASADKAAE